ncbi:MAG: ribosome-binding factor A, partial [Chloroflexi bacterium]|nr:ribosome-binding factor A [Chloroflexota bacterium]
MPSDTRVRRVAERIRNDLSEILLRGADDPRLAGVTITDV